ncbi:MAG: glycosyltransferase family 39 protein [Myxococcota bacterium]
MDWIALTGLLAALVATAGAAFLELRGRTRAALGCLVLAAVCLRVPPAAHLGLSPWDERYHALVARNALEHPLVPMLVAEPVVEPAPDDWRHAHVWLHKPPGMTWLIAASYALFGANEIALRVPSVLVSSLGVALVFAIARRFASQRAALLAAALAAWHARSLLLVAGLRATDHVDVGMTSAVALGALAALRAGESLGDVRARFASRVALVGAATALAYYVKETPALIVPAILFFALAARGAGWRTRIGAVAGALGVALLLVLPWQLYTAHAFPELAAFARARGSRYFLNVVDHQGGPWYFHLANLPLDFGWLAPIALAAFARESLRARPELRPALWWALAVYGVFTLAATKMQSYVLVAAPAVFAALGWFAVDALSPRLRGLALLTVAANALLAVLLVEAPFDAKARDPLWARELRRLGAEVARLPPGKRVIFGVGSPIECMFYVRATCAPGEPSTADADEARARGFAVAVYGESALPGVTSLPIDPDSVAARRLVAALQLRGARDALIFNARDAADLREYVQRSLQHASASAELPAPSRGLRRKLDAGALLVVLLRPGEPPPDALQRAFPQALFFADATYARELHSASP